MKPLLLAVLLAVMQTTPPNPRKPANNPTLGGSNVTSDSGAKQPPTSQAQSSVYPSKPGATKADGGQRAQQNAENSVGISKLPPVSVKRDWADWGYWGFGGLLVLVGFFQVILLRRQASIMGQQTKLSEDTLGAIKRQADLMERQTTATEIAANAAKTNADSFMNAERAWVLLEKIEVADITVSQKIGSRVSFTYTFKNYGRTPAFILEIVSHFRRYSSLAELPSDPEEVQQHTILGLPEGGIPVPPGDATNPMTEELAPAPTVSESETDQIRGGNLILYASLFVKYKDVNGRFGTTSVGGMYKLRERPMGFQGFMRCGPDVYNRCT